MDDIFEAVARPKIRIVHVHSRDQIFGISHHLETIARLRKSTGSDNIDRKTLSKWLAIYMSFGPPQIELETLLEAEDRVEKIIESLRSQFFPEIQKTIEVVFSESGPLGVISTFPKEINLPWLLSISREVFRYMESEEDLYFFLAHELFHALRRFRRPNDYSLEPLKDAFKALPWHLPKTDPSWNRWNRKFKDSVMQRVTSHQMEEVQMDIKAMHLVIQLQKNPSTIGHFVEKLAHLSSQSLVVLATHPFTPGRASTLNGVARHAFSHQSFQAATPLPDCFRKLGASHEFIVMDHLSRTQRLFARLKTTPIGKEPINSFWSRITFIASPEKFEERVDRIDANIPPDLLGGSPLVLSAYVQALADHLREPPSELGILSLSRSLRRNLTWGGIVARDVRRKIREFVDAVEHRIRENHPTWRRYWRTLAEQEQITFQTLTTVVDISHLRQLARPLSAAGYDSDDYPVFYLDHPERFEQLMEAYHRFLSTHHESLLSSLAREDLESRHIARLFRRYSQLVNSIVERCLASPELKHFRKRWNFFKDQFPNQWAATLFFRSESNSTFAVFGRPLSFLEKLQGVEQNTWGLRWVKQLQQTTNAAELLTKVRQSVHSKGLDADIHFDAFSFYANKLASFSLSATEIETILESPAYWPPSWNPRYQASEDLPRYFQEDAFWIDQERAASYQAFLKNQLESLELVSTWSGAFRWWTRFVARGVTETTDAWIEAIFERCPSHRRVWLANNLWNFGRIRSLGFRLKLFRVVLENHPTWTAIRHLAEGSPERDALVFDALHSIFDRFPEVSLERQEALNALATQGQSSYEETKTITEWDITSSNFSSDISRPSSFLLSWREGLTLQMIGQFYVELSERSVEDRIAVIRYFSSPEGEPPILKLRDEHKDPEINRAKFRGTTRYVADYLSRKSEPALFCIKYYFGFSRLKENYRSSTPAVRAQFLDPLMIGPRGLLRTRQGKAAINDLLFSRQSEYRSLAGDLLEGFRRSLLRHAMAQDDSHVVSFLLASMVNSGDDQLGKVLRSLFSANTALTKLGQQLHSSQLLSEFNEDLKGLKDEAARIFRINVYEWLLAVATTNQPRDALQGIVLGRILRVGSVKVAVEAWIYGKRKVLFIIQPNAQFLGASSFALIRGAFDYAIERGHHKLKAAVPMIDRAKDVFSGEINLVQERQRARLLSTRYDSARFDHQTFDSPGDLPFKPELVAAVDYADFIQLEDLGAEQLHQFALENIEAEWPILTESLQSSDKVALRIFDRDRHERNTLRQTNGRNLVIDAGQVTSISESDMTTLWNLLTAVESYQQDFISQSELAQFLAENLEVSAILRHRSIIRKAIARTSKALGPFRLTAILSHLQGEGIRSPPEWLDYLTALNAASSWDSYLQNPSAGIKQRVASRIGEALRQQWEKMTPFQRCTVGLRRLSF